MLQCHPHPGEFSNKSRPLHCSYFMGLQRKQGVPVNEGEQFDIRLTVDEFKHSVNMYLSRKSGMVIHVTHVKRRNIPNFVFPGGVRPSRPSKTTWDSRQISEAKVSNNSGADKSSEGKGVSDGLDEGRKRKRIDDNLENNLRIGKCFAAIPSSSGEHEGSPSVGNVSSCSIGGNLVTANGLGESSGEIAENNITDILKNSKNLAGSSTQNDELDGSLRCTPPSKILSASNDTSCSKEAEKLAIEKIMSGPYVAHQALPQELDELEDDFEYRNEIKGSGGAAKGSPVVSSISNTVVVALADAPVAAPLTSSNGAGPSASLYPNGGLEELEVFFSISRTFIVCPEEYQITISIFLSIFVSFYFGWLCLLVCYIYISCHFLLLVMWEFKILHFWSFQCI